MVFSTFILRYVESKFTLLTYLMENNTVITVISYCTKGLNNSKTKQKPTVSLPCTTKHSFVNTAMRFSTTDIINYYFTRKQYECKNVRMQRGFRVKRCSIKLWDLTGNGLLKCKTMPYCNTMRQTQSIIITLSCSVEVSRIETTSVQAAAEAPLEHVPQWHKSIKSRVFILTEES